MLTRVALEIAERITVNWPNRRAIGGTPTGRFHTFVTLVLAGRKKLVHVVLCDVDADPS